MKRGSSQMITTTTPTAAAPTLEREVPCLRCGYNLRGLDPQGQCPECGHLVHVSVLAWEEQQRRLPSILESDPRWIRTVAEGLLVAVIVFVLMAALAYAPSFMSAWKTTPRKWTLGIACTMWVLSWAAAWKLSARERQDESSNTRVRRALRIAATMYLAVPFIAGLGPHYNAGWEIVVPLLMCTLAGFVATGAWFIQIGWLAARAGDLTGPIEARLLLFANVIGFFVALMPELDAPEDSLSQMLGSYICQFGTVEWLYRLRLSFYNHMTPNLFEIVGVILPLWSAILCLRLFGILRRTAAARIASDTTAR
jgi:hypothetical protein